MKRKIHITEEQLDTIVKNINEVTTVNFTSDNFEKGTTLPAMAQFAKNAAVANPSNSVNVNGKEVNSSTDPNSFANDLKKNAQDIADGTVSEGKKFITKRQIKEARLNKLVKESICVIKKKNLK